MELFEKLIVNDWKSFGPIQGLRFQFLSNGQGNYLLFDMKEEKIVAVVKGTISFNPTDEEVDLLRTKTTKISLLSEGYAPEVDEHSMHL